MSLKQLKLTIFCILFCSASFVAANTVSISDKIKNFNKVESTGEASNNRPSNPINHHPLPTISQAAIIPALPHLGAKSYLLIDFLSDKIIAEQASEERVEPASLTKMMTVYVIDHALKSNRLSLTDKVKISEKAWRATGSRMFLDVNSEVPVEELLKGVIIQSGNDASIALAEHIAGSEEAFAELMNYAAQQLGMKNTHFVNATGLPDPNHYTTAKDMAILGKALIHDFPETYSLYAQKEFTYKDIKQTNRNRLLWQHDWVDGIKTGHTESAGFCLVASGKQDNMRLIAVLMGAKDDNLRTDETNKLLTYGFRFYETKKLYEKNLPVQQARIWMAKQKMVDLALADDLYITLGKGQYEKLKTNIILEKDIKAPLAAGTVLGKLEVQLDDKIIAERPIITVKEVVQANIFERLIDAIKLTLKSILAKLGL